MSRWIGVLALVAFGCAACNGEAPQTPAGPTQTGTALQGPSSMAQGARIMGNVSVGVPLAATGAQGVGTSFSSPAGTAFTGVPLSAMAAQVVGTSISSAVSAGGGFLLEGVPPGAVQLRFVGAGVDASVALSPVQSGDFVSVLVSVAATTAMVQSESRNAGGKVELEGRIEEFPGVPTSSLVVSGRLVTTSESTTYRDGSSVPRSFADLAIGQRAEAEEPGIPEEDGARVALDLAPAYEEIERR